MTSGEDELEALIERALELEEQGEDPDLLALAEGRTAVAEALARALATVRRLPDLQAASAGREPWVGRLIADRYRLEARIGAGAMGVVYQALDQSLGRPVAIKILRSGLFVQAEAKARFEREAEVLASVRHPAIVTLHDRGETSEGEVFLVMELLEGLPLSDLLEEAQELESDGERQDTAWIAHHLGLEALDEPSYLRASVRWTADLAAGLQAVHAASCLHRDVKPSNIFLREDGRPALLDFGLAARDDDALITREGSALGTPAYMAPEALDGRSAPGPARDIYGLTATLYHLLTSRRPFEGTPSQVLTGLATREPTLAAKLRPNLPRDLQAILEHGMARDPARRYPTASALEADLRAFLDHRPVSARPTSSLTRSWRRLRRSRAALGGVVVLLVGLLFLGALEVRTAWRATRQERFDEAWSHVLVNSTISGVPADRVSAVPEVRSARAHRLDAAVEAALSPIPARVLRAAHRLDHGDPRGAAADMRAVARSAGTPYANALAASFDALDSDAVGAGDLVATNLPEPRSREDFFLASYQALRELRAGDALGLLASEQLDGYRPGEELRLLFYMPLNGFSGPEELGRGAAAWYEWTIRFEESLGRRTVLTAHALGLALSMQERRQAALEMLDDAIALAPDETDPRISAARIAFRCGRHGDVLGYAQPVLDSRPQYPKPYVSLIRSSLEQGHWQDAERWLGVAEQAGAVLDEPERRELEADVWALRARTADDIEVAKGFARKAVAGYESVAGFKETPRSAAARAIREGKLGRLFDAMLDALAEDPTNERRAAAALEVMPESLDDKNREHLFAFFLRAYGLDPADIAVPPAADVPETGSDSQLAH
jgi:serine/threonine protein kinase